MRRILLLLSIFSLACPSWAADKTQSVTVAQLSQLLAAVHSQSDDKIAKDLERMTLTERVPTVQLAQWESTLPGRRSREALTALADLSMLLPPPAASILPAPPPDIKTQGAIFSHAIDYVAGSLARLPDFYATRTTQHFQDDPAHQGGTKISTYNMQMPSSNGRNVSSTVRVVTSYNNAAQPLHLTRQSSFQVTYSDGVEMRGTQKMDAAAINQAASGLMTAGEFGPILSVVLKDAVHGHIVWAYWEQSPSGKLAVFQYSVPEGKSSYVLALRYGNRDEKLFPAYRGEIAIDPATGAILRITLVAGSPRSQYVMESAMSVDYGSVALGSKDYICPLRGVALLRTAPNSGGLQTQINDTTFTGYHLLRGDVTILPAQQ